MRGREHVSCRGALPRSSEGLRWGVVEKKELRGPSASSGGGSGEVQDEALGPHSWHAGERRERDRGLNWGKNHLRDF